MPHKDKEEKRIWSAKWWDKMRSDPVSWERHLEGQRRRRAKLKLNPDVWEKHKTKRREYERKRLDKLKRDPSRWNMFLEKERKRSRRLREKMMLDPVCRERRLAQRRMWATKDRLLLSDSYIANDLIQGTSLKRADIPLSLIDFKRAQLKLRRWLRENGSSEEYGGTEGCGVNDVGGGAVRSEAVSAGA